MCNICNDLAAYLDVFYQSNNNLKNETKELLYAEYLCLTENFNFNIVSHNYASTPNKLIVLL